MARWLWAPIDEDILIDATAESQKEDAKDPPHAKEKEKRSLPLCRWILQNKRCPFGRRCHFRHVPHYQPKLILRRSS